MYSDAILCMNSFKSKLKNLLVILRIINTCTDAIIIQTVVLFTYLF